jgi:hypothetical protein
MAIPDQQPSNDPVRWMMQTAKQSQSDIVRLDNSRAATEWIHPNLDNGLVPATGQQAPRYRIRKPYTLEFQGVPDVSAAGSFAYGMVAFNLATESMYPLDSYNFYGEVYYQNDTGGRNFDAKYTVSTLGEVSVQYPYPPIAPWEIKVTPDFNTLGATPIAVGNNQFVWTVPDELQNHVIIGAAGMISTLSSSGDVEVTISEYPGGTEILAARVLILEGNYVDFVTAYALGYQLVTGQMLSIDVTQAGTGAYGLAIVVSLI